MSDKPIIDVARIARAALDKANKAVQIAERAQSIAQISGVFNVTVTGTIIPSIALNTAIAAVVQANSYFKCQKIANTGVMASSGWS